MFEAEPAFRFNTWEAGVLVHLPDPGVPFGLDLGAIPRDDAGLKELPAFKTFVSLDLGLTDITDAGLTECTKRKNLTSLNLCETRITDAGLRVLAQLTHLT
ncbi:MAG: hypothetical protein RMI91_02510 [Gemmatales bacterium]|nr:hypothetical protein [Gemmatales bacterium]MDW7993499.1 hypothetical protein [Gemmatales bacterium]